MIPSQYSTFSLIKVGRLLPWLSNTRLYFNGVINDKSCVIKIF